MGTGRSGQCVAQIVAPGCVQGHGNGLTLNKQAELRTRGARPNVQGMNLETRIKAETQACAPTSQSLPEATVLLVPRKHRHPGGRQCLDEDRQSVVEGKSESVRVDLGGRRIIKKKKKN